MSKTQPEPVPPTVFVSYSWDDELHKRWVRELAGRLRGDGVDVTLDQWELQPGDRLPAFMEAAIREHDFVIIVCTPHYKQRSDARTGGVGYEGDIMTGELLGQRDDRKFIPILRRGDATEAVPTWLSGKYYVDLRETAGVEEWYGDLLSTLHGQREAAPPLGQPPKMGASPHRPRAMAAAQALPVTPQPASALPWVTKGQVTALPSSERDADGFAWKLRRGDETRSIVVWISRSAMASADSGLPAEVVQAKRTRGRSVLGDLLGLDNPPGEVLVYSHGAQWESPEASGGEESASPEEGETHESRESDRDNRSGLGDSRATRLGLLKELLHGILEGKDAAKEALDSGERVTPSLINAEKHVRTTMKQLGDHEFPLDLTNFAGNAQYAVTAMSMWQAAYAAVEAMLIEAS